MLTIIIICVGVVSLYVFSKTPPFVRNTYFFWLCFSLYFFSVFIFFCFLFPLALPLLLLLGAKFTSFLKVPLIISIIAVFSFAGLCRIVPKLHGISEGKFAITCNSLFLIMFLISCEYYKELLIGKYLVGHNPDCIDVMPFIISLREIDRDINYSRGTHAVFIENGRTFIWSYASLKFSDVGEAPSINSPCRNNRKLLPNGSLVIDW